MELKLHYCIHCFVVVIPSEKSDSRDRNLTDMSN